MEREPFENSELQKKWRFDPPTILLSPRQRVKKALLWPLVRLGALLGRVNTLLLLSLFYVLFLGPVSVIRRLLGKDDLEKRIHRNGATWHTRTNTTTDADRLRRQF